MQHRKFKAYLLVLFFSLLLLLRFLLLRGAAAAFALFFFPFSFFYADSQTLCLWCFVWRFFYILDETESIIKLRSEGPLFERR